MLNGRTRKFIKAGNSFAVTVDKTVVDRYFDGGKAPIIMEFDERTEEISIKKRISKKAAKRKIIHSKVTPEFQAWVEKSLDEDAESMKELANL